MDIAIVTIDKNNKSSAVNYADDFYDYNDFGIGNDYSGLILLIDMDTRTVWISTSGSAKNLYTDSYISNMLDRIQINLKSKNYFIGAKNFIQMSQEKEFSSSNSIKRTPAEKRKIIIIFSIIGIIISISGSSIFCGIKSFKHKPVKIANNANDYLDRASFKVTKRNDKFVSTNTTRVARYESYNSSSGSSGGSSSHTGSSGISHGGGGRSF